MSLLEDVFLQDEADEALQLERIIEGDENDDGRLHREQNSDSDENSEKEDEAVEDKRRVDPTSTKAKRVVRNPRFMLNPARLTGPLGIQVLPDHFKDFKFKGKGHEKEDLDFVLKKLEHWAYRLYPKFTFEDCLKKIETLGKKRPVMVHLQKIRSDQLIMEETVVQKDSSDEEPSALQEEDEFDKLLQQQIELARATPGPGSVKKPGVTSTPIVDKRSLMPKATSSPSISDEQKERMMKNRKLAEERRLARLKAQSSNPNGTFVNLTCNIANITEDNDNTDTNISNITNNKSSKKNRSNVIESSDDDDRLQINETIPADVHENDNANVIDITEGYQRKSKIINGEVIDLIDAGNKEIGTKKHKSNVFFDSSDDEDDITAVNKAVTVDVHDNTKYVDKENYIEKYKMHVRETNTLDITSVNKENINENGYNNMQTQNEKAENYIVENYNELNDNADPFGETKLNDEKLQEIDNEAKSELLPVTSDSIIKAIADLQEAETNTLDIEVHEANKIDNHVNNENIETQHARIVNKTVESCNEVNDDVEKSNGTKLDDVNTQESPNATDSEINVQSGSKLKTVVEDSDQKDKIDVVKTVNDSFTINKENIDNNVNSEMVLDDLMDVDFSDDF